MGKCYDIEDWEAEIACLRSDNAELLDALEGAKAQICAVKDLCHQHDPKTGYTKEVNVYEIDAAAGNLIKINAAIARAKGDA